MNLAVYCLHYCGGIVKQEVCLFEPWFCYRSFKCLQLLQKFQLFERGNKGKRCSMGREDYCS